MKRAFLILTIAALTLPAIALGKGPSEATISGPGTGGGITFGGEGQSSGAVALFLVAAAAVVLRRRARPATA